MQKGRYELNNMTHLKGEALNVGFDGSFKLEFHGLKVTSDGGLLAHRDLDDALGLFDSVSTDFHDNRTGRKIQQVLLTLLNQSVYRRLARLTEYDIVLFD